MTMPRIKFTVNDYMTTPDDRRCQLLDGELIVAPSPTDRHQEISLSITLALQQFVAANDLGRIRYAPLEVWPESHWPGFALRQSDVFQPYAAQ